MQPLRWADGHPVLVAAAAAIGIAIRLLTGATVRWMGCAPEPRQRVCFGNHTSHLDVFLVWAALPTDIRLRTRPVGARDYWGAESPVRRLLTRLAGTVLVDRDNAGLAAREQQIEAIVAALGTASTLVPASGVGSVVLFALALREFVTLTPTRRADHRVLVVQASDVLQHVWGKGFGRTPMAPTIGPNKTWEGLLGGTGTVTLLGTALWWITPFTTGQAAGLSLLLTRLDFAAPVFFHATRDLVGE